MEEKLTKAAIIESLHNKLSLSRADIHRVIDELFEEIKDGLKEDRVVKDCIWDLRDAKPED